MSTGTALRCLLLLVAAASLLGCQRQAASDDAVDQAACSEFGGQVVCRGRFLSVYGELAEADGTLVIRNSLGTLELSIDRNAVADACLGSLVHGVGIYLDSPESLVEIRALRRRISPVDTLNCRL